MVSRYYRRRLELIHEDIFDALNGPLTEDQFIEIIEAIQINCADILERLGEESENGL